MTALGLAARWRSPEDQHCLDDLNHDSVVHHRTRICKDQRGRAIGVDPGKPGTGLCMRQAVPAECLLQSRRGKSDLFHGSLVADMDAA